jgi:hypothetical protein
VVFFWVFFGLGRTWLAGYVCVALFVPRTVTQNQIHTWSDGVCMFMEGGNRGVNTWNV